MAPLAVPFAAAMSSCCRASETPLLKVTMYGTDPAAGAVLVVSVELEEVSVELEEVSVVAVVSDEDADVVSVVEALPEGVVSVLVVRTENVSPKAPDAISPNAKRTARPIPIRRDRFRSVRWTFSDPCRALSLITARRLSHQVLPSLTRTPTPGGARRSGQARNDQLAAEDVPPRLLVP
jgi:hypothetical protein